MILDQFGRVIRAAAPASAAPAAPAAHQAPLRWTADRPAEARPAPCASRPSAPTPTPRYAYLPRWGLADHGSGSDEAERAEGDDRGQVLTRTLHAAVYALGGAAAVHLLRYLLVVVNRSTPIPVWLDLLSSAAVLVFGVCAVVSMVFGLVAFVRWALAQRTAAYAEAHRRDPRSVVGQVLLAAVPLVNVVGAPLLLAEAALCRADGAGRAVERIKRLAVGWAIVNLVALVAVGYRIGAAAGDSVQVSADALAIVTISFAVSAWFCHWAAPRLVSILDDDRTSASRRLVMA